MPSRTTFTRRGVSSFVENRVHTMPETILKTLSADIAGKARDEISRELVGLAADIAKRELADRHDGHIEEPCATPGCGVFKPPVHGALSHTVTEEEINLQA